MLSIALSASFFTAGVLTSLFLSSGGGEVVLEEVPVKKSENKTEQENHLTNYALLGQKDLIETSYKNRVEKKDLVPPVSGLIVSHHLLAADLVAGALAYAENDSIETVLLIAPDHFARSNSLVSTTLADWETSYGVIEPESDLINRLITNNKIQLNNNALKQEHGIYNILPFIKKSLPDAKVVPLIVHNSATQEDINFLVDYLNTLLPEKTLVIGSFDFSHDATSLSSRFHDQQSLAVLNSHDKKGALRMDIDSRTGVSVLMGLMEKQNTNFKLLTRSDSSIYTNNPSQADVTSYITGYYISDKYVYSDDLVSDSIQLLAFGDLMMDRFIREQQANYGTNFPLEKLGRVFYGNDLSLVNLEGTITNNPTQAGEEENLQFTFDPSVLNSFKLNNLDLVSLANNHSQDFGRNGLAETKNHLNLNKINYFGDYYNQKEISAVKLVRGQKVAFIGFHQFANNNLEYILQEIKDLSAVNDYVVVYAHWGEEFSNSVSAIQKELAHKFIDAGADVVLGAHPHVVQPMEVYNNKPIFYSLGNFVFDQAMTPEVKTGLSVGLSMSKDKLETYLFPLAMNKQFQPEIMSPKKTEEWYKDFASKSIGLTEPLKNKLKSGLLILE